MAYYFRVISDEAEDFYRDIEINEDASFEELALAIQMAVDYDPSPMISFAVCDKQWHPEVILQPKEFIEDDKVCSLEETKLQDLVKRVKQKILFSFDVLNGRSFFIELERIDKGVILPNPLCTQEKGKPPPQYKDEGII